MREEGIPVPEVGEMVRVPSCGGCSYVEIDRVMRRVEDPEAAAAYYSDVLGLQRLWQDETSVGLGFPETTTSETNRPSTARDEFPPPSRPRASSRCGPGAARG